MSAGVCANASAYRVVNLPHSSNFVDELKLAMNAGGDYVVTWYEQKAPGDWRTYLQTGNVSRPFKSSPFTFGGDAEPTGPYPIVDSTGEKSLAWLQRSGDDIVTRFIAPPTPGKKAVALIRNTEVHFARLADNGLVGPVNLVSALPSPTAIHGAQVSLDGSGNPTVYWKRGSHRCEPSIALTVAATPSCTEVDQAVLVASGDSSGVFGLAQFAGVGCGEATMLQAASGAAAMLMPCDKHMRYTYRQPGQPFARPQSLTNRPGRFPGLWSSVLLPGDRVVVAYEATRTVGKRQPAGHYQLSTMILVASGQIGQPLGRPKVAHIIRKWDPFLSGLQPTPKLLVGNGGHAYLRWFERDRTKLALVTPSLRLGHTMTVPGYDRRTIDAMKAEVAISDSGRALAAWKFYSVRTKPAIRATTFQVPTR